MSEEKKCPRCRGVVEEKQGVRKPFYACYKCKDYFTVEQVESGIVEEVKRRVRVGKKK